MEITITEYVLLYFIYAVFGWTLEVTCKLIESKKFVNRGFLIGPYCPIYGWGAIIITLLSYRYSNDLVALFVMTVIACGILEYVTSWVMEKLFKARWWDYSKRKFNLNGRVCLGTLVPFGILGLLLTYVTNPFIINQLNKVDPIILNIITLVILIIYAVDNIVSSVVITGFRKTTVQVGKEGRQDNTEEITNKVKEILLTRSWTYRRLIAAFPKFVAIKQKIKEISAEVKENAEEMKANINEKAQDMMTSINDRREYTRRKTRISLQLSQRKWEHALKEENFNKK